ncbi:MAG: hypothetical protein HY646_16035 [Acidobacteria bacterium]|nr:hypothetical protein [Acidobacteriota bacterium]
MAFLLYEVDPRGPTPMLLHAGQTFRLAGYNLLYRAWQHKECPLNRGWHVSANELIALHSSGRHSYETHRLIIDFDPESKKRVGLVEILDIYAYTYESDTVAGDSAWTPLMLRLRSTFYKEYDRPVTAADKERIYYGENAGEFVEFLYLNGADKGWNWGKNGRTNAVFIQDDARNFFRQFF